MPPPPPANKAVVTDFAVDVEETDINTYVRATNVAVDVEEVNTTTFVDVSDFAVMVEYISTEGDICGPGTIGLVSFLQFARGLECYLSREIDEVGLSITGELTLGGWVMFGTRGAGHKTAIMGKWYEPLEDRSYILYKENNNQIKFEVSNDGTNNLNSISDQGIHYDLMHWHYIVGRFTPTKEIALFVDGFWYRDSANIFASIHDGDEPFEIARANRDNYFDGKMCHMFVSAATINDADIEAMYYHTKAMFARPGVAPVYPSGITERMTDAALMIEYLPSDVLHMTDAALMIEYLPADVIRMTDAALMVEESPPDYERVTDIALMIEYAPDNYERQTNIALMIEYYTDDYIRATSSAVMIEYRSSTSSSSSSTTTSSSSTNIP